MTSKTFRHIGLEYLFYYFVIILSITIFFQQVFVLNLGASFKTYELCSLLIMCLFIVRKNIKIASYYSLLLFFAFVVAPSISLLFYYFDDDKIGYYSVYPHALEIFRSNMNIIPMFIFLYYIFNWFVFSYIITNKFVFANKIRVIKFFINTGTIISLYNIYSFFCGFLFGAPDFIPSFLDFRSVSGFTSGRVTGFSDEPGSYIFLQIWLVLYLLFLKNIYSSKKRFIFLVINILSLMLTFSSQLITFIIVVALGYFLKGNYLFRIKVVISFIVICISAYFVLNYLGLLGLFEYVLIDKISNFISSPNHTLDSGSFRSYTSSIGFSIFQDYPIWGCGPGSSCFYMWKYEFSQGIDVFGERISFLSYPQNIYSKYSAEMGSFGLLFFILFLFFIALDLYRFRKYDSIIFVGFLGFISSLMMFFSIYPETSLYIWFNIALVLNQLYFFKINK